MEEIRLLKEETVARFVTEQWNAGNGLHICGACGFNFAGVLKGTFYNEDGTEREINIASEARFCPLCGSRFARNGGAENLDWEVQEAMREQANEDALIARCLEEYPEEVLKGGEMKCGF